MDFFSPFRKNTQNERFCAHIEDRLCDEESERERDRREQGRRDGDRLWVSVQDVSTWNKRTNERTTPIVLLLLLKTLYALC